MDSFNLNIPMKTMHFILVLILLSCISLARADIKPEPMKAKRVCIADLSLGINANALQIRDWRDPAIIKALGELQTKILRYPGGTVSNYWNWREGWLGDNIPKNAPPQIAKFKKTPKRITLDTLLPALEASGTEPIFTLNLYTSDIDEQLAFLREARKLGMPVRYVELGNEYYWGKHKDRFPNGTAYAREVPGWVKKIQKEFPGVKVGIVIKAEEEEQDFITSKNSWTPETFAALAGVRDGLPDAVIIHPYTKPGSARYKQLLGQQLSAKDLRDIFASATLSAIKVDATLALTSLPFDCWITEYSLMDKDGLIQSRWAHSLYTLLETLSLMSDGKTKVLLYHSFVGAPSFATHVSQDYAAVYKQQFGRSPETNALTAPGLAIQCVNKAADGMTSLQSVPLSSPVENFVEKAAFVFSLEKTCRALVLNLSAEPVAIAVERLGSIESFSDQVLELYNAQPMQPVLSLAEDVVYSKKKLNKEITLPPYSFAYIH